MQIIQPYIQAIQMHSLCPTKNEKNILHYSYVNQFSEMVLLC